MAFKEWDVDKLLAQMPGYLFRQWQEYLALFDDEELRMASLKAFIGNIAIAGGDVKRKDGGNFKIADFMPQTEEEEKSMEDADADGENWRAMKSMLFGVAGKEG